MKISDLKEGCLYKDYSKRGHCKNGTFIIKIREDGEVYVSDTYWNNNPNSDFLNNDYRKATDEFVKDFEEVLKFDDYRIVNRWESIQDFSESDYIQIHLNH